MARQQLATHQLASFHQTREDTAYLVRNAILDTFVHFAKSGFEWSISLPTVLIALQNNFCFHPLPG